MARIEAHITAAFLCFYVTVQTVTAIVSHWTIRAAEVQLRSFLICLTRNIWVASFKPDVSLNESQSSVDLVPNIQTLGCDRQTEISVDQTVSNHNAVWALRGPVSKFVAFCGPTSAVPQLISVCTTLQTLHTNCNINSTKTGNKVRNISNIGVREVLISILPHPQLVDSVDNNCDAARSLSL